MRGAPDVRLQWVGPGTTVRLEPPPGADVDPAGRIDALSAGAWIGEDGGPGERTGLAQLLDDEEAGSAVLPPVEDEAVPALLRFAQENPGLFLFLEEAARPAADRGPLSCPAENVALLSRPASSDLSLSALVAAVEARDFVPVRAPSRLPAPSRRRRSALPGGGWKAAEGAIRRILEWRRWQGLRRSLDHGTRWVLFETATPALIRAVERDVRRFLFDLELDGLLAPWGGERVAVRVELSQEDEEDDAERFVLEVNARLSGGRDVAIGSFPAGSRALAPLAAREGAPARRT